MESDINTEVIRLIKTVDSNCYYLKAPSDVSPPYIIVSDISSNYPRDTMEDLPDTIFSVSVFSPSFNSAKTLIESIRPVLKDGDLYALNIVGLKLLNTIDLGYSTELAQIIDQYRVQIQF